MSYPPIDDESHYQPNLLKGLDYTLLNAFLHEQLAWKPVS